GALLLGGKFEIGEGHLLSHGSVLSQAGVEVVYGKVGDLFRPSLAHLALLCKLHVQSRYLFLKNKNPSLLNNASFFVLINESVYPYAIAWIPH
ncbi:hypothetical protein, partial [Chromobacterium violaceum]